MPVVTLHNARQLLSDYGSPVINITPLYDISQYKWWQLFRRKYFMVTKEISVMLSTGEVVTVPQGFKTDLSSVPQLLWALYPPYGNFLLAAVLHDFLYVNHSKEPKVFQTITTEREADKEMLLWSVVLNDNQTDNFDRYKGVRIFGKKWWKGNVNFIRQ